MRRSKRYILNLGDQSVTAVLTTDGGQVDMQLDDNPLGEVDARCVLGGRAWSLRLHNRHYLVHLSPLDDQGAVTATVNGHPVQLTVADEIRALARRATEQNDGGGTLVADMPGLVVNIKVTVGQKVKRHEPVIIVEAMKMQNELGAGIDGIVQEIPVAEGQPVNPGDKLVVIRPEEE